MPRSSAGRELTGRAPSVRVGAAAGLSGAPVAEAAIEQRFAGLHDGPARSSSTQVTLRAFEPVTADLALVDIDQVAHGMLDPTGATIPEARFLARGVAEKRDGRWAFRFMGIILLVA
jgi:hypothetical protein